MKIVYIAGPLTTGWDGKDRVFIENHVRNAEAYQVALANLGIGAFCPHTHSSFHNEKGGKASEAYYYELDFEFLKRASDALLAVPGWEQSKGATSEVEWAIKNNIPVFYPTSPEDLAEIIEWAK